MFRKLISNLPFAPQLIEQVVFYTRRLSRENVTRKLTVVFSILAFVVQIFTIMVPAESSVAASTNDVIYGGIGTENPKQKLLEVYDKDRDSRGRDGIQKLFERFGIDRRAIVESSRTTISSANRNLRSVGRNPHSELDEKFWVAGHHYYLRPLWTWDSSGPSTYPALEGRRANGKRFWVLLSCGNMVINDELPDKPTPQEQPNPDEPQSPPPPPPLPPDIKQEKQVSNLTAGIDNAHNTTVAAGDILEYRLLTTNTGGSTQTDFFIEENINDVLEYADLTEISPGGVLTDGILTWPAVRILPGHTITKTFTVRVKDPIPQTPRSASDPQSFDLMMDNVYGNAVTVKLPGALPKTVEATVTQLPNTGVSLNVIVSSLFTAMVTYFFIRNRQLIKELKLLRRFNQQGQPS